MQRHTSPVDRLPDEILSYVLALGAFIDEDDRPKPEAHEHISSCTQVSYGYSVFVAAVSKHWRRVALSTSELWSRIYMTTDDAIEESATDEDSFYCARLFLSRSGNYALDIFIDARDPDWDFSEFDCSSAGSTPLIDYDPESDYRHPFSLAHMRVALEIVRPYLHRARSLVVLTDRWAPMHLALNVFSAGTPNGKRGDVEPPRAPLLQSLILMRCNEFVSYAPYFIPEELAGRAFLPFGCAEPGVALPRLKQLTLAGVHVDWFTFIPRLPSLSLKSLQLTYHCAAVRPSVSEFRQLLDRCAMLEQLTIKVSGPANLSEGHALEPLPLPRLRKLTLGFESPGAAIDLLRMIEAPDLRELGLQDARDPAGLDEQPADPLLAYCARQSAHIPVGGFRLHELALYPVFPHLTAMSLNEVGASEHAFQLLFASAPRLHSLMLINTPAAATRALRPGRPCDAPFCVCPQLDRLVVRGFETAMDPALMGVLGERAEYGATVRDVQMQPVVSGRSASEADEVAEAYEDFEGELDVAMGELPPLPHFDLDLEAWPADDVESTDIQDVPTALESAIVLSSS
ncbi:hypothetical protein POSPLADRAFT_1070199 [Postia placenta MAD-698-R-SB12]|nr:hypothetical protein POSPLADRAFT_1070199 [Postia placenta MAD-698-R-SB12]OSX62303.1 hypothetical protein POSPLADRAFT_1070199 [Postia placenta MAD-698-R-SB12]